MDDPRLSSFVKKSLKNKTKLDLFSNVFVVFHKDIFDSNCTYPTFNSNTIECYLHKIPHLTEVFIYLNDDVFLRNILIENLFFENRLPFSFFGLKSWNCSNEYYINKMKNNPASWSLYNTIRLFENKFDLNLQITTSHQAIIMNKTSCNLAWTLFEKEIKDKVKLRFREPLSKNDLNFPFLANLVSIYYGYSLAIDLKKHNVKSYFCTGSNLSRLNNILNTMKSIFQS